MARTESYWRQLQARLDEQAAARHQVRRSAASRAATEAEMDHLLKVVTEQVRRRQFAESTPDPLQRLKEAIAAATAAVTEATPSAPSPAPAPAPEPVKPLHLMDPQEFRDHVRQTWDTVGTGMQSPVWRPQEPVSIAQFIAAGTDTAGRS